MEYCGTSTPCPHPLINQATNKQSAYEQNDERNETDSLSVGSLLCSRKNMRMNSNSNSKTLFHKDCSLGSVKNLSNN